MSFLSDAGSPGITSEVPGHPPVTPAPGSRASRRARRRGRRSERARRLTLGAGVLGLSVVFLVAVLGPLIAPHDPDANLASPYQGPTRSMWLGADFLGRDVVSRVLHGGHTVLLYALIATVAAYALGLTIGMVSGFRRGWIDHLMMRTVDVLMAFPSLVFLLLLAAAFGRGIGAIVVATAIIQATGIARIVRTATLEQAVRGFVEAAIARGEPTAVILVREILPNIRGTLAADIGLRFTWSALLIASVNFLGLGLQPPAADWGLMISENRGGLGLNAWAVVAPAMILGLLTVSINLITDALARSEG